LNQPIVIQQSDHTQGEILREIVDSAYRGPVHLFHSIEECQEFLDHQQIIVAYVDLNPGDDVKQWIRECPDDVIGLINREWTEDDIEAFVDAGLSDYVFKPYQPDRIRRQVKHRVESTRADSATT